MIPYKIWAIFFIPLLVVSSLFGNWPNWRGPNFDGSAVGGFKYPINFSPNKRVRWIYDLDGPSASTPIIMNNRVFLSGVNLAVGDSDRPALLSICLHQKTDI